MDYKYRIKGPTSPYWHGYHSKEDIMRRFNLTESDIALINDGVVIQAFRNKYYGEKVYQSKELFSIARMEEKKPKKDKLLDEIDSVLYHLSQYGNTYVPELNDRLDQEIRMNFGEYKVEEATHEMGGGYIINVRK